MAEEHPLTVFVAENGEVADAVIKLLEAKGIAVDPYVPPIEAPTAPLMGVSEVVWKRNEIEIRVQDVARAAEARELLETAIAGAAVRAVREKRANRAGTVTAVCEDCGKSSEWPAEVMGTTEICPQCQGYMDIPDPDDDWSGVDFGQSEDDAANENEEEK